MLLKDCAVRKFAIDHFNQIVRHELLRMISWKVGIETGFKLSVGKNYKFIERYISEDLWEKLCPPTGWIPMKHMGSIISMPSIVQGGIR